MAFAGVGTYRVRDMTLALLLLPLSRRYELFQRWARAAPAYWRADGRAERLPLHIIIARHTAYIYDYIVERNFSKI